MMEDNMHRVTSEIAYARVEATEDKERVSPKGSKELFSLSEGKEQQSLDAKEPRYKNIVHLWEYLLELLAEESCRLLISWSNKERMEFKLKNPSEVARRWGLFKRKKAMNYEKLSRSLRYYYQLGIIKKVPGQRLVYKFNKLPYKYEPGVTRSLRYASKISASIYDEQERRPVTLPSTSNTSAFIKKPLGFIPTGHPVRTILSWPAVHISRCSMCLVPCSTPLICSCGSGNTGSRIMFPPVDLRTSLSFPPFGFRSFEPVSPVFDAFPPSCKMR